MSCRIRGGGPTAVLFVHGDLASKDRIDHAAPFFPSDFRVIGLDWRGCSDSDRPPSGSNYTNYRMEDHAANMLAVLDTSSASFCHLATHSTGGVIASHVLLIQPERLGKVLALDPIAPMGMPFD